MTDSVGPRHLIPSAVIGKNRAMKKLRTFRAASLGIAIAAALMLFSYAVWSTPWFVWG